MVFIFLKMMIGIVLESMQKEHEEFDREQGEGEAGVVPFLQRFLLYCAEKSNIR